MEGLTEAKFLDQTLHLSHSTNYDTIVSYWGSHKVVL
jgi:hypothetical protein